MSHRERIRQRADVLHFPDKPSNRPHHNLLTNTDNPQHSPIQDSSEDLKSASIHQNTILGLQRQYGNQYVRRLLAEPSNGIDRQRVSRLRAVGEWHGAANLRDRRHVSISARTQDEWVKFLKEHADEKDGSRELYEFMLSAMGQYPSIYTDDDITINGGPSRQEGTDLMIALLTTGADIDLPDKGDEGDSSRHDYGDVMSRFNVQFAGLALQQMTRGKDGRPREFDKSDVANVAAYGEQVKGMPNWAGIGAGDGSNPAMTLISAAVGSAFGAATQVLQAGNDKKQQAFKREAYILLRNSAMTIRGILDSIEEPAQTPPSLLMEAFSGTVNALAAATGFLKVGYQIAAWGLSGVAGSWFSMITIGGRDVKQDIRKLKDDFHKQLNDLSTITLVDGSAKPIENVSDIETIKTVFDTILNY